MIARLLKILFAIEFLVAIPAVFSFWSQTGGQYHLDLMFWPWKFGLGLTVAALITGMTREFVRNQGKWSGKVLGLSALLLLAVLTAGLVTYYCHLNEPNDSDPDDPVTTTHTSMTLNQQAQITVS